MPDRNSRSAGAPTAHRWAAPLSGLAAALLLIALCGLVALHHGRPLGIDRFLHDWSRAHRTGDVTTAARLLTRTGTGVPAYLLAALAGLIGGGRRAWWQGIGLAWLALGVVQVIRLALMKIMERPRPPVADWATTASGMAFPSGHATTSAMVAALFLVALGRRLSRAWFAAGAAAAVLWAIGVGVTRVYLGVHWPTDVVAGWVLVLALVFAVSSAARGTGSQHLRRRPGEPTSRPAPRTR